MSTDGHRRRRRVPIAASVAAVLLLSLAFVGVDSVLSLRTRPGSRDIDLHSSVAARVANGEPYYQVMSEELTARGYPVRPPFAWRFPTLAWLLALLPSRSAAHASLWSISALSIGTWARVLGLGGGTVGLVLIAPLWLGFSELAVYMHELWAGQLIALGLGLWMNSNRRASLAVLILAALIREHAVLALLVVAVAAWRRRLSPLSWLLGLLGVAAFTAAHLIAVVLHTPAQGITNGWGGLLGWAFFVSSIQSHVLLMASPYWVAAAAAAITVPALWLWQEGRIVAIVVTAYAVVFCVVARPDNWYWGLLIIPLLPLGCIALAHEYTGRVKRVQTTAPAIGRCVGGSSGASCSK